MVEECTAAMTSPFINGQPNSNALRELVYWTLNQSPLCHNSPFRLRARGIQFFYMTSQLSAFAHPQ